MKKRYLFLIPLFGLGLASSLVSRATFATKAEGGDPYDNLPESGSVPADSYFANAWYQDIGTRRLGDRELLTIQRSDWGCRGNFINRTFDATSFEITLELSKLLPRTGIQLIFGSAPGSYATESTRQMVMDVIVGEAVPGSYIITTSVSGAHNVSIPEFNDGKQWADDANFTGVQVETTDFTVALKIEKKNESFTDIHVNDIVTTVSNSALYPLFEDPTVSNISLGLFNNSGAMQPLVIKSVGDATDKVYFGETGDFTLVKKGLADLQNAKLDTLEEVKAAKDDYDILANKYAALYAHDRAYFQAEFTVVTDLINEAIARVGNKLAVILLSENLAVLEESIKDLTTVEAVDAAIAAHDLYLATKTTIDVETLEADDLASLENIEAKFATALALLEKGKVDVYEASLKAFEDKVKRLEGNADILEAQTLRAAIPTKYNALIEEAKANAFMERLAAADQALQENTSLKHDNWVQGATTNVVTKQDGSLDVTTYGAAIDTVREQSSGIFCKEQISASKFELDLNISRLPSKNGSWITMGIMEKPDMWIYAETDLVQENKGIFFLITYINSETLGVQAFLCSLTSNRFYDSNLTQTITIPMAKDVKVKFFEETVTVAGVTDTYFRMSFNDVTFDQENISAKKLKTIFGTEKSGYFFIASSGFSASNPAQFSLKAINGKSPTANTIKGDDAAPSSSDTTKTFVKGSGNLTFNLVTSELQSVKVDGTVLGSDKYGYANNTLTIQSSYLETLSEGNHTIEAVCKNGTITWMVSVQGSGDKPVTPDAPKSGCGGSIVAGSIIVSTIAVAGLVAVALKKRKED